MRPRGKFFCSVATLLGLPLAGPAFAQETTSYSYDALGRLTQSATSGGPNNAILAATCFDAAGNRTLYFVGTGSVPSCPTSTPTPSPTPTPPPGNHAPVAVADSLTLQCNTGTGFNVLTNDTDADGDALSLLSVQTTGSPSISIANPTVGIVSISAGSVYGTHSRTYVVSDGHGGTATGVINITVVAGGPYC